MPIRIPQWKMYWSRTTSLPTLVSLNFRPDRPITYLKKFRVFMAVIFIRGLRKITRFNLFLAKTRIMKKITVLVFILSGSILVNAQKEKVKTTPKAQAPVCRNLFDSASYAVGVNVATFYKQRGIDKLNIALVTKAIDD